MPSTRLRPRRELGRALAEVCGTLSTLLVEDEVDGACSKPQQTGIGVTHSYSRPVITQGNSKGSRPMEAAKVENFSIKAKSAVGLPKVETNDQWTQPLLRRGSRNHWSKI